MNKKNWDALLPSGFEKNLRLLEDRATLN